MTPSNGNGSGASSSSSGPSGSGAPLSDGTARRLVVALELLARRMGVGSPAVSGFANRDHGGAGHPAMAAMIAAAGAAAAAGAVAKARGGVADPGASGRPVQVEVVGWKAALPGGSRPGGAALPAGTAPAIGGPRALPEKIDDAEIVRIVSSVPRMLPAAAGAMWNAPKPPAVPKDRPATGGGGGAGGGAWATVANSAGAAMVKAFAPVVGPMMAFSAVLSQTGSGMSTFQKAINVMAATLAPVLLPPMLLLAAGIMTLSDIVWAKLSPNLAGWAQLITSTLVPAIESAAGSLADLVDAIAWVVEVAKNPSKLVTGTDAERAAAAAGGAAPGGAAVKNAGVLTDIAAAGFNPMTFMKNRFLGNDVSSRVSAAGIDGAGAGGGGAGGTAPTPPPVARPGDRLRSNIAAGQAERAAPAAGGSGGASAFAGNLEMVMSSLTKAMGPKAEYTSAAGAARARQLAGANGDPLDMKALLRSIDGVREVMSGVRAGINQQNAPPPTPQVPPSGRTG